jgi:hypothetical protein
MFYDYKKATMGHIGAVLTQERGSHLGKGTCNDTFTFLCFPIIKIVYQMIQPAFASSIRPGKAFSLDK